MAHQIDTQAVADRAEQMAAENGTASQDEIWSAMMEINRGRGSLATQTRARAQVAEILAGRAASRSAAVAAPAAMPTIDPTTPAGAQFLAMVARRPEFREPRVQRDTGICNRCGYDSVECGCR